MRPVDVTLYHLTGDDVDSEIGWHIEATVGPGYEVSFGDVIGQHTSGARGSIVPLDFEQWLEIEELGMEVVAALEAKAIAAAIDARADQVHARVDAYRDRMKARVLERTRGA